jgi:hypothetical protein
MYTNLGTQLNFSTAYHPEKEGETEQTNQILEDILHMYMMDQHKHWKEFFPPIEFAYNNSYKIPIKMAPFEFLYGRPCWTPLCLDRLEDRVLVGPKVMQEMEDQIHTIIQRIKEAQDQHKRYVDVHQVDRSYEVGDLVFL